MIVGAAGVLGQAYPSKPIRLYTGSPGGSNDSAARLIAQGISGPLGQPVVVDNRGQVISVEVAAKSPPDGYSLLLTGDAIWLAPLLRGLSDPMTEYSPISLLGSAPNILVVHSSLPVKSVKELITLAKARPGELNYASAPAGGIDHISGELFKSMTGTNIVWVPFKSSGTALTGLMGGDVQMMFGGVFLVSASVKAGRLKALAVTSAQPSVLAVGLPTMADSGLPGYELVGSDAMYAPAKTPAAIINQVNREVVRFLRTPEAKEQYLSRGAEVIASSPEEHAAKLKSRVTVIGKLIKDAGIKGD